MNPQTACAALDRASFFPFTFFVVDGLHKALTARDTRVHEGKGSPACFVSRDVVPFLMRRVAWIVVVAILGTSPLLAQGKRLWLLRAPGEMVEYDPLTFAVRKDDQSSRRGCEVTSKSFGESCWPSPVLHTSVVAAV